jgi:hypothetical protein
MARWLKEGGAIPADRELMAELVAPEYSEGPLGIVLEKKEHMRERGLKSPDSADSLALTFSYPVHTQAMSDLVGRGDHLVQSEFDPWSDQAMQGKPYPELKQRYVAPGFSLKPEWTHEQGWTGDDWNDAAASDALRREIWNEPE